VSQWYQNYQFPILSMWSQSGLFLAKTASVCGVLSQVGQSYCHRRFKLFLSIFTQMSHPAVKTSL
jgi:hypothetical protein